jgi:hypothetical protein
VHKYFGVFGILPIDCKYELYNVDRRLSGLYLIRKKPYLAYLQ